MQLNPAFTRPSSWATVPSHALYPQRHRRDEPLQISELLTNCAVPDTAEASWKSEAQHRLANAPTARDTPAGVASGWIIVLAAALVVYNVLLCLDYPVSYDQWDTRILGQYSEQLLVYLYPVHPRGYTWPMPAPQIQRSGPVRVQSALLLGQSAAASLLIGGQKVAELTAQHRVSAQEAALARGDTEYNPTDDAMAGGTPVAMRGLVTSEVWPALARWTPEYVAAAMPAVKPHISTEHEIRMHSIAHPLGQVKGVEWKRGWDEEEMPTTEFFRGNRHAYLFLPLRDLPDAMRAELTSTAAPAASLVLPRC